MVHLGFLFYAQLCLVLEIDSAAAMQLLLYGSWYALSPTFHLCRSQEYGAIVLYFMNFERARPLIIG